MIPIYSFSKKKVALFGLGKSGLATAKSLIAGGADLIVWDDKKEIIINAKKKGFYTKDFRKISWNDIHALIISPGIPLTYPTPHWSVLLARKHRVEIIGDIELFIRERNSFLLKENLSMTSCPFIAITGTNGKSTTTSLISYCLKKLGCLVQLGGNIGVPILSLDPFTEKTFYVIECSSYQIDLTPSINPTIGILTNLVSDHVDRHGSVKNYFMIKRKLLMSSEISIICIDNTTCCKIYKFLKKQQKNTIAVANDCILHEGFFSLENYFFSIFNRKIKNIGIPKKNAFLCGEHNIKNLLLTVACCFSLKFKENILEMTSSFHGLPHRMELVRKIKNVLYVNDSKATNAHATSAALSTFNNIYWILGGVVKEDGIKSLFKFFPKIKKIYLIGESSDNFLKIIGNLVSTTISKTLDRAIKHASYDASYDTKKDVVILLSPACSSFDQFTSYKERGNLFRSLVLNENFIKEI